MMKKLVSAKTPKVHVHAFLNHCVKNTGLSSLLSQCCVFVSHLVEVHLGKNVTGQQISRVVRFFMKWADDSDGKGGFFEPRMLTSKLSSYMAQSQDLLKNYNQFGLTTDKGSGVGGQSLQNSFFVTDDSHGVMAPPQVWHPQNLF